MRLFIALAGAALLPALATPALAQAADSSSIVGAWELTYETPRGETTLKLTFIEDGDTFSGTAETRRGTRPLTDVSVDGNRIAFSLEFRGRGDRSFTMRFTGMVEGDSATGTLTGPRGREIPWTAKRVAG